ncbi:SPOR domain-containing protein [Candidatus Omnitrophota bacterium]
MKLDVHTRELCIVAVFLGLTGCGSGMVETGTAVSGRSGMKEEIDPFDLGDEFAIAQQAQSSSETGTSGTVPDGNSPAADGNPAATGRTGEDSVPTLRLPVPDDDIMGFRVQIDMFSSESEAQQCKRKAELKFAEKVYVVYIPPFFRVRIGDFETKEEADNYVKKMKNAGHKKSRWIRSTINTQ